MTPTHQSLTHPDTATDPAQLEELAKAKLTQNGWFYASSNAGQSHTHTANRQAFYRHRIVPRMLVDTNQRDTATEIFGHKVSAPIGFAPFGINKIYHPAGEVPVARVASELGLPYCLSTAGSQPIEDVGPANEAGAEKGAKSAGEGNPVRFFQLYMPHDDELTRCRQRFHSLHTHPRYLAARLAPRRRSNIELRFLPWHWRGSRFV